MYQALKSQQGFTFIEMLLVLCITFVILTVTTGFVLKEPTRSGNDEDLHLLELFLMESYAVGKAHETAQVRFDKSTNIVKLFANPDFVNAYKTLQLPNTKSMGLTNPEILHVKPSGFQNTGTYWLYYHDGTSNKLPIGLTYGRVKDGG